MTYAIVEVFKTLQGEGMYAGHSAVFVRFAGCNLWSGRDEDRHRDSVRNKAHCPLWCDTDFLKRATMDHQQLMEAITSHGADLVVFTGGEPMLQLTRELVVACNKEGLRTCVETNGTVEANRGVLGALNHVCVSPKHDIEDLKLVMQMGREGWFSFGGWSSELKVVVPAYDPLKYDRLRELFTRCYVSPQADTLMRGTSLIVKDNEQRAAEFCLSYPGWALSLQTHKHLELP